MRDRVERWNQGKRQIIISKINLVNKGLIRQEKLPLSASTNPQLLQFLNDKKVQQQESQKLKFGQNCSVIFQNINEKNFSVVKQFLPHESVYCLNIWTASLQIQAVLNLFNEKSQKIKHSIFKIKGTKAIILRQSDWAHLTLKIKTSIRSLYSVVNIQITSLKMNFRSKSSHTLFKKKEVVDELNQFIKDNLGNVNSLKKSSSNNFITKNKHFLGSTRTFSSSAMRNSSNSIVSTRKDLINFEISKSRFLGHFKKMSPSKSQLYESQKINFNTSKNHQFAKIASMFYIFNFLDYSLKAQKDYHRKKIFQLKISYLCHQFIRMLKQKTKTKNAQSTKNKLSINMIIPLHSTFSHQTVVKKATMSLFSHLKQLLGYVDAMNIVSYSIRYKGSVRRIQRWWKRKIIQIKNQNRSKVSKVSKIKNNKNKINYLDFDFGDLRQKSNESEKDF